MSCRLRPMLFSRAIVRAVQSRTTSRITRNSFAASGVRCLKTSTGLVGLPVEPNGRLVLLEESQKVMDSAKKQLPAETAYRRSIEQWFTYINSTAQKNAEVEDIEKELDLGQIEEVIIMCKNEAKLIDEYAATRMWEIVEREKEFMTSKLQEMKDSIYFTDPQSAPPPAAAPSQPPPKK